MSILCVGSVALDSVETPFGKADRVLGGSAVYFGAAATAFHPVQIVGVVGDDYPLDDLGFLEARGADLGGIERAAGESFFWAGRYHYDLNTRDTLDTRLGVFADFDPKIPDAFRGARYVFLGNIDPVLQLDVLDQVAAPDVVACDTMNYWIEGSRDALLRLLERVDILLVNDEEVRQLAGKSNLLKAASWVQDRGPGIVVVKKGEHGAILFGDDWIFYVPGYPLEEIFDPTGAGDAFAGGFMGYLAQSDSVDAAHLRRAMVYGSALGSFACEEFSIGRLRDLTRDEVSERVRHFRRLTAFETDFEGDGAVGAVASAATGSPDGS
ncbi:MAG: sugar kinase [Gemmatimonadetes bacterium]|nr:sugar kinase [Gemmatimonadota bacterium]NNF14512.1 sugar kinase [Gemmatimonadota bacterium]NNL29723.1 sugar kinase [Gemmatimonadota bacterium]